MDRFTALLAEFAVVYWVAIVSLLYIKRIRAHWGEDNLDSLKWLMLNMRKYYRWNWLPLALVLAPASEELLFRAPIVFLFEDLSPLAWYGVLASGLVFGLTHWSGNKISLNLLVKEWQADRHTSDSVSKELKRLAEERLKAVLALRTFHVLTASALGVVAGYYGILCQSLFVSVGIHAVSNLVLPTIFRVITIITIIVLVGVGLVVDCVPRFFRFMFLEWDWR